jgi:hypothetical protein
MLQQSNAKLLSCIYMFHLYLFNISTDSKVPPIGYIGKLLEGFSLASKPLEPKERFPPPQLPKSFRPYHMFKRAPETNQAAPVVSGSAAARQQPANAVTRSIALGEKPIFGK